MLLTKTAVRTFKLRKDGYDEIYSVQVEQPLIVLNYSLSHSDGEYFEGVISLNLKKCTKFAKENKIEFSEFIARVINHEFLHYLFHTEHDEETGHNLDNIAKKYKDYWLW